MQKSSTKIRKTRIGRVTSDKMDKTVVVTISERLRHPLYTKAIKRTLKYKAHDEDKSCNVGDRVLIVETRPISKEKRWKVVKVLEKAAK